MELPMLRALISWLLHDHGKSCDRPLRLHSSLLQGINMFTP